MALTTDERTTGTDGWPPTAVSYLTAVEEALAGVDAEERQDLVEDLRAHIDELLEEEGEGLDLVARLGAPDSYAAELVESAGLGTPTARPRHRRVGDRLSVLREQAVVAATLSWLQQLRPAWWVARGYGLALLIAIMTSGLPLSLSVPVPAVLASRVVGLVATLGLIWLSVEVGAQRISTRGRLRRLLVVTASILAGLVLWWAALDAAAYGPTDGAWSEEQYLYEDRLTVEQEMSRQSLTLPGGEPITNIYAFDVEGNRLEDVLLYDGVGNPVVLQEVIDGTGFPFDQFGLQTDYRRDVNGRIVANLYPLTQYRVGRPDDLAPVDLTDDGVMAADAPQPADPDIGPRVVPEVAIPPLETLDADDTPTARPDPLPGPTPRVPE